MGCPRPGHPGRSRGDLAASTAIASTSRPRFLTGRKFATTNYALLYTAKGAAAVLVSLCNRLQAETKSWFLVFVIMIAFDWLAALAAIFVLRPLRRRWQRETLEHTRAID